MAHASFTKTNTASPIFLSRLENGEIFRFFNDREEQLYIKNYSTCLDLDTPDDSVYCTCLNDGNTIRSSKFSQVIPTEINISWKDEED